MGQRGSLSRASGGGVLGESLGPLTRLGVFDHDALKVKCVAAHNRDGVEPIKIDAALVLLGLKTSYLAGIPEKPIQPTVTVEI